MGEFMRTPAIADFSAVTSLKSGGASQGKEGGGECGGSRTGINSIFPDAVADKQATTAVICHP